MSNSSPEWWSLANLDGTDELSLHQWGWAVTTVGGSRYNLPPRRGTDMTLAYRPGQVHRRKVPDARTVTLQMFMVGWDPATGNAPDDQLTQWNDNWETLRRAVYRNYLITDHRLRLIRRHFLTAPTFPTVRSGDIAVQGDPGVPAPGKRLLTSFANAEISGTMDPSMTGRYRSEFSIDFLLADPYFYGDEVSATIAPNTDTFVWNDGYDNVSAGYCTIDLVGPLVNPTIYNLTTNPDSWVKWTGTIPQGSTFRITTTKFAIEDITLAKRVNKVAGITSYGARYWFNLLPGANKIRLGSDGGSGHMLLTYRPPYV